MKVDIVIPTYRRPEKLARCLNSILGQSYSNWECCVIVNGGDEETYDLLDKFEKRDKRIWCKTGNGYVIDAWNYFTRNFHERRNYDALAWLVDDVELWSNYLEQLVLCMQDNFPDTDGVIGGRQECPGRPDYTFKWYGQVLLGRKFIDRYKERNYHVCCPDYFHFYQDEEMWMFANSLEKFLNCEKAILKHYHPSFLPREMDDTHPRVRGTVMRQDTETYAQRRKQQLLWGKSWELVRFDKK